MRTSKRFEAFEFGEFDKQVEKASKNILGKYGNPKSDQSPVTKYSFLQCFAQGTKTKQKDIINEILVIDASDDVIREAIPVLDAAAPSGSPKYKPSNHPYNLDAGRSFSGLNCDAAGALICGVTSTGTKYLDGTLPQLLTDNDPVIVNSDKDNGIELSSSTSDSDVVENEDSLKEQALDHCVDGCVIDTTVVVSPNFVIYDDMYFTKPVLTFSCCWIKMEGLPVCGIKEPFCFELAVGDIINIESQWCGGVETTVVNLHLKSKDTKVAANTKTGSDIVELKFAVSDPKWAERQEAIKSLNMRYKAKWNLVSNIGTTRNEDGCPGSNIFFSKHFFSNSGGSFEVVIYPKGDPDAVTISKRDIELLRPKTFINDTIIDFYIKYLKNKIKPKEKHRFLFFNSFFFRKLADLDKDPSRAAFQLVRKWTRKVNLFEKDYIFIPVNFSLHWSLIVICHPGDVANTEDEDVEKLPKVPCILHMDSIKGSHRGLKNLFRSYLWEEWKERQNKLPEDVSSKFLNLRFVPLELPQQENSFDCGLFLLHYVELFLECAPADFSPFKIRKFSNFLSKDWFPPAEASLKRAHIKKLIYEIVEDSSEKVPPDPCNDDKYPSSELPGIDERDDDVEFLQHTHNPPEACHSKYSSSNADQEVEIIHLAATPLSGVQCSKEQFSVMMESLEPRAAGSYPSFGQMVSVDRIKNVKSPIEKQEGEETQEQCAYSPTEKASGLQITEVTEILTPVDSARELRALEQPSFLVGSIHIVDVEDGDSWSGTSVGGSPMLSEVRLTQERYKSPSSSTSNDELPACVVEDSEDEDATFDSNETGKSHFRLGKILGESNSRKDIADKASNMPPGSVMLEHLAAKRLRLTPPEGGRRLMRSRLR